MSDTNTPATGDNPSPANQPNPNPNADKQVVTVGGREYDLSTPEGVEELNKRVANADSHISTLEQEREADRARLDELAKQTQITQGVKDVLNNLNQGQNQPAQPTTEADQAAQTAAAQQAVNDNPGLSAEAIAKIVSDQMSQTFAQQATAQQDAAFVAEVGGEEALASAAEEVGMSVDDLKALARKSPGAAKRLLKPSAPSDRSSGVNTAALSRNPAANPTRQESTGYGKLRTVRERQAVVQRLAREAGLQA